jgi:hypothetical protein
MLKNVNDKRTVLKDLDGEKLESVDDDVLRLVAGGRWPADGPTCTQCNDTDGNTCTMCNDED